MSQFDESLERAASEVDTWPDWKLDTHSLNQRNKRRGAGEKLPKPTALEIENAALQERNAELEAIAKNAMDIGRGLRDAELGFTVPFELVENQVPFTYIRKSDLLELHGKLDRALSELTKTIEKCAKVAEDWNEGYSHTGKDIAKEIRKLNEIR